MDTIDLNVATRVPKGKGGARQLRAKGMVPGVLYGEGQDNISIGLKPRDVVDILRSPRGSNSILNIEVDGSKHLGVIRDYQVHPVQRKLLHVDLLRVLPDTVLKVSVPVKLEGRSAGEEKGAKLILAAREIKIFCQVDNIPENISIDVTPYELGFSYYSRDLVLADGMHLANTGVFPIFSILGIRVLQDEEEEEEASAAAAAAGAAEKDADTKGE
jgi:large subunit ribosomal protein L25